MVDGSEDGGASRGASTKESGSARIAGPPWDLQAIACPSRAAPRGRAPGRPILSREPLDRGWGRTRHARNDSTARAGGTAPRGAPGQPPESAGREISLDGLEGLS